MKIKKQIFNIREVSKGFTLIEIITSIGIFALIITAIVGVSVSVIMAQRKAIAIQNIQGNLNYALEFMAREMRMGIAFSQTSTDNIFFINQSNENIVYQLTLDKKIQRSADGGLSFVDFIAGDVLVENLKFFLSGQTVGDGLQTLITITIRLKSKGVAVTISDIQTSIAPRMIDQ